ncbi:4-hydroxybenzoate 3-monooxygenase [Amylibacter ulvae]|uniref:4-hydroxybenzoate 3-monooxygenase n=1 Tax=Paramylibacter ulvae TaxID=1651968 RepID=A0ABQ3D843_9RHOB|nr:4-hydroxybenzoate 3-monooxygenase [Amylibacter ulvae]GHA61609.1 4-hydroxybenzoate 3-monooxygenase [Amylibacter ulvae]
MKTQVCIIGGGPSGLMLSHILDANGIDNVVLERQSKEYVMGRIRAGVLEHNTVQMLRDYGLNERLDKIGKPKDGTLILWENRPEFFIDIKKWTGKQMMAYGQTYITEDLYAARERDGGAVICEAQNVALHDIESDTPHVTYEKDGNIHRVDCRFIAGCDGFHGPSRKAIPSSHSQEFHREYPFGWMGIMVEQPPVENFIYAYHSDGMAMAAQRNEMLSRYYVQAPINDTPEDWSDDRFWETLLTRFPEEYAKKIKTGPSIEKSMAPLRSFVSEPMRHGSLFIAGDAAHIVPPTGAKGLNLAFSDVHYLQRALVSYFKGGNVALIDSYSQTALRRVWSAENISWRLTKLLHVFPGEDPFEQKLRENDYDLLLMSEAAQHALAYEYMGLPFED